MDKKQAREMLGKEVFENDGGLLSLSWYLSWKPNEETAVLDGQFSADELEAIAWWMKNKSIA